MTQYATTSTIQRQLFENSKPEPQAAAAASALLPPHNHRKTMDDAPMTVIPVPADLSVPSRERTMLLMRLNIAAYPPCRDKLEHGHNCSFSEDTMRRVVDNAQSLYGSNVTTLEEEIAASEAFESHNWDLLTGGFGNNNFSHTVRSIPEETARYDTGVSATQWDIGETTTVLAFRGSFSHGDYANIENWMLDYLLEKSTERMKQAWVDDAGLEWTDEMQKRHDRHDDTLAKVALRTHQRFWNERTFPKELEEALSAAPNASSLRASLEGGGLTLEEARETGYWKLTKSIVDRVYAESVLAGNRTLVLTGHSQGGTRAQLASMYLQHEHGVKIPTVSFAATGAACMARLLFDKSANLLRDVDPFTGHDQIVEYVHPLDPWGNSMLGQDSGGTICHLGDNNNGHRRQQNNFTTTDNNATNATNASVDQDNSGTTDSSSASAPSASALLEYCSPVYGWRGPILVANEHSPVVAENRELKRNFQRCRYFTHSARAMFVALSEGLLEDGTTRGGCFEAMTIPRDDPNGICPAGRVSLREDGVYGLVLIFFLVVLLLQFCFCLRSWRRRVQTRGYRTGLDNAEMGTGDQLELPRIA